MGQGMERVCTKCGNVIEANALICNKCNAELEKKENFADADGNKETTEVVAADASIEKTTAAQENQASQPYPQQQGNAAQPYPQ